MKKLIPILSILVLFAALELALAGLNLIMPWDEFVHRVGIRHAKFVINPEFEKCAHFLRDPDLLWRPKPRSGKGRSHVNNLGFRGPDINPQKPDSVIRVICLGNSCTFGWDVENPSETYPGRLWSKLKQKHPQLAFEVINAGVDGYSIYQIHHYWRKQISSLDPDVITVYAAFNDIVYAPFEEDKDIILPRISCDVLNFLFSSRIIRASNALVKRIAKLIDRGEFITPYNRNKGILKRVAPADYQNYLSNIVVEANQKNVKIIFITTPFIARYPLSLIPFPKIIGVGNKQKIQWVRHAIVTRLWFEKVTHLGLYDRELDLSLAKIGLHPELPTPYFKAAFCYSSVGNTIKAAEFFHKADSLDVIRQYLKHYNQIMRDVAEEYNILLVDCETVFSAIDNEHLFTYDGIHLNERGHALIADELFKSLNILLKDEFSVNPRLLPTTP